MRAIVSKGWSSRMAKAPGQEVEVPRECYVVDKIPHEYVHCKHSLSSRRVLTVSKAGCSRRSMRRCTMAARGRPEQVFEVSWLSYPAFMIF